VSEQIGLGATLVPPRSLLRSLPGPVWGFDPSVERISLGIVSPAGVEAHTLSLQQGGDYAGVRLARAESALCQWFATLARLDWPTADGLAPRQIPVAVAIEEPYGGAQTQTPVQSLMMCGAIQMAVWRTFGSRTRVLLQEKKKGGWSHIGVGPTSWKAKAMGAGNGFAKKPAITAWAMAVTDWPGPGPERPQDEADAIGVATWAAMQVAVRASEGKQPSEGPR
jgi:hypothetical protein